MGLKKHVGKPWMPGYRYAALLPPLSLNFFVADVARSVAFYREVFAAEAHYHDVDFAALRVGPVEVMLHADHTHNEHPWVVGDIAQGAARGVGLQLRLLGLDPDELERRARAWGALVVKPAINQAHGWRETFVRDPDGYEWAVGILIDPAKGPIPSMPPAV